MSSSGIDFVLVCGILVTKTSAYIFNRISPEVKSPRCAKLEVENIGALMIRLRLGVFYMI